ncbi:XRE family transcriptional regulator [Paenibacillus oralis]|uniref:XRE family transcriptional regulator n=1 Tax=Paenibacillus oralis TaxID=2490856 RepID=A0A3P3TE98_9BACL|nr:helix-turn-helix transcriptional regulator [Paenibacillus oralis]RRJ54763.1 XRE family transcriptional regulator [Paenibacillus oralis]
MGTFAEQIGAKIRIHRVAKNWTQEQLAELSGTTASYIGQLERGEKDVRISTLEKIAHALDMSVNDLFDDELEGFLRKQQWAWESMLLLLKHPGKKQYQAYRILRELLDPSWPEQG